jgi:hypothetical protein
MGLRFRRSWGVLPGVRLNLGLKSGSVSFGTRGMHYTVGTRGQRVTVGLPGTGLYWTQKIHWPFGGRWVGGATQAPGYVQPATTAPQARAMNQVAQLPRVQTLHAPRSLTQTNQAPVPPAAQRLHAPHFGPVHQSRMHSQNATRAVQSAPATFRHVFVPVWLAWAVLAVIAIAILCFCAGAIGQLLR